MFAQLHGTYTIDRSKPASATNYHNFQSAANDLDFGRRDDSATVNGPGVSGAVIFNVANGMYPGQFVLLLITGVSPSNSITFQSASADSSKVVLFDSTIYTQNQDNFLVELSGAQYITFKGMSFLRPNGGNVIYLYNLSGHILLENNVIVGNDNKSSGVTDNQEYGSNNSFVGNYFKNTGAGIHFDNSSKNLDSNYIIRDNVFQNVANAIYSHNSVNLQITGNKISGFTDTSACAINLQSVYGPATIKDNVIDIKGHSKLTGILARSCNIKSNLSYDSIRLVIADNMIALHSTNSGSSYIGIDFELNEFSNLVYNTVLIDSSFSKYSYPLFLGFGATDNFCTILDNDFVNRNGFYGLYLSGTPDSTDTLDFNNYYARAGLMVINQGGGDSIFNDFQSLYNFQYIDKLSFDHHSISVLPTFVSDSNLHTKSYVLHGKGGPFPAVKDDIDGKLRNKIHPDIGANELIIKHDLGLDSVKTPVTAICENVSLPVRLSITNYGPATEAQIKVYFKVKNISDSGSAFVDSGTIIPDGSDTFATSLKLNIPDTGRYTILAYIHQDSDENSTNDTVYYNISVVASPKPSFTFSRACVGQPVSFTNATKSDSSIKFVWSFGDGDSSVQKDTSHSYILDTTYKVTLESINSIGCTDTVSLPVNPLPLTYSSFKFQTIDSSVQFTVDDSTFKQYEWNFGDGDTSSLFNPIHIYKQDKIYIVTLNVKNSNECIDSVQELVDISGAGISGQKVRTINFSVYPDPFTDQATIHYQLDQPLPVQIVLYNNYGIALKEIVNGYLAPGSYSYVIDAKELGISPGVYYLRFNSGGNTETRRILYLK